MWCAIGRRHHRRGVPDLIGQPDVALQFGALPVRLDRLMPLLAGKGSIAVAAILGKQRCQQMFVAGFPGALVGFHEVVDIHWFLLLNQAAMMP
jgi:hypothetical protein